MSNRSLAITLLAIVVLTLMLTATSGISSIQQAKAEMPGQKGQDIGDKDLLQADATIIAGILILLTISSIKNQPLLTLYSFIGLVRFALSEMLLLIADLFNFAAGSFVAGWFIIVSRLAAIAGLVILTVALAVLIEYNLHVRREIRERRPWSD